MKNRNHNAGLEVGNGKIATIRKTKFLFISDQGGLDVQNENTTTCRNCILPKDYNSAKLPIFAQFSSVQKLCAPVDEILDDL